MKRLNGNSTTVAAARKVTARVGQVSATNSKSSTSRSSRSRSRVGKRNVKKFGSQKTCKIQFKQPSTKCQRKQTDAERTEPLRRAAMSGQRKKRMLTRDERRETPIRKKNAMSTKNNEEVSRERWH